MKNGEKIAAIARKFGKNESFIRARSEQSGTAKKKFEFVQRKKCECVESERTRSFEQSRTHYQHRKNGRYANVLDPTSHLQKSASRHDYIREIEQSRITDFMKQN